jgi:HK97 family phage prohead protease
MSTLTLPELDIVRTTLVPCGYRAADDQEAEREGLGLMDVRFSPFNTWYRIDSFWEGSFLERTVPGAFKRTIGAHNAATKVDAHNIKTLFNHGQDMFINQKLLGDIEELKEEPDGPRSTVWLWDTSYNRDLLPGLRSGAYGSSFMFRVIKEEWNEEPEASDHNPDGIPERTIKEARVFEAGPVTWPASPTAAAGMRCISATDTYYEHLARQDPSRVDGLRSKLIALRSNGPATRTPKDPGPAAIEPTDPARSHSVGLTHAQRRERLYPTLKGHRS